MNKGFLELIFISFLKIISKYKNKIYWVFKVKNYSVEVACRDEELITLGFGLADGSIDDENLLNWIIDHS